MRRSGIGILFAIIIIAAIIIILILALGGNHNNNNGSRPPAGSSPGSGAATANNPAGGTVNIRDMMFTPSQITVQKGGTVTWTNNDTTTHTVVDDLANVGGPHSGNIPTGGTYSFTFTKSGSFQYHCTIHPSMRGTIVVK